jgi:hypothetical protein
MLNSKQKLYMWRTTDRGVNVCDANVCGCMTFMTVFQLNVIKCCFKYRVMANRMSLVIYKVRAWQCGCRREYNLRS